MNFSNSSDKFCTPVRIAIAIVIGLTLSNIAVASVLADSVARILAAKPSNYLSVRDFGAKCDGVTDDAAAVQRAINATPKILFPRGTCLLNSTVILRNGTKLRGEGVNISIVKQGGVSGPSMGSFYADSGRASGTLAGIEFANMTIYGQSDVLGFSEFQHLVSLNGVKDVLVDNVEFKGFRGDALYIGSGSKAGDERHNENVTVKGSIFDGVNYSNRNGISIIDANGVLIESSKFLNTTNPKMPGAIDIEPDANSFHVIKNIVIRNDRFINIGGSAGVISFVFNSHLNQAPVNITVQGNIVSGAATGVFYLGGVRLTPISPPNNLVISNNKISTLRRPFEIYGANHFKINGNVFSGAQSASLIGYVNATDKCMYGAVSNNVFKNLKNDGLVVFSADYLEISRNRFVDIGNGEAGNYAIDFGIGTSSYVRIKDNIITAVLGKTVFAIQKEAGHTFTPSTNFAGNNVFIGVSGNAFQTGHQ